MVALNCERRYQLIQCVRKYNIRFYIHVHVKTNFMFLIFQTRRDSGAGCF